MAPQLWAWCRTLPILLAFSQYSNVAILTPRDPILEVVLMFAIALFLVYFAFFSWLITPDRSAMQSAFA